MHRSRALIANQDGHKLEQIDALFVELIPILILHQVKPYHVSPVPLVSSHYQVLLAKIPAFQ